MENNLISAKEAHTQTDNMMGEEVKAQIRQVANAIGKAICKNQYSVNVGMWALPKTLQVLREQGYTVKQYSGDQRDGSYLSISW